MNGRCQHSGKLCRAAAKKTRKITIISTVLVLVLVWTRSSWRDVFFQAGFSSDDLTRLYGAKLLMVSGPIWINNLQNCKKGAKSGGPYGFRWVTPLKNTTSRAFARDSPVEQCVRKGAVLNLELPVQVDPLLDKNIHTAFTEQGCAIEIPTLNNEKAPPTSADNANTENHTIFMSF